jgi:hypothetical protein
LKWNMTCLCWFWIVKYKGIELEFVKRFKYLGVDIITKLGWGIYEWIATFWYDWCEKMKVGPNNFWVLHFIILHACITHQKFPDTLLYIKRDTRSIVNFVLNSMIKYALYSEKLESFNQYYKGTSSQDLLTALCWAELYLKIIFLNDSDWNICRKSSLYIFFVKTSLYIFQYFVNFFWRVQDPRLKCLPLVELFVLYRLWKFELDRTSPWGVINETTFKMSLYKVSEISFFQKVRLFFSWNKPDKRQLFLMRFLLKEFSFFSYSLHSTNSITVRVRIMFVSLCTKMYKCLSYYMNGERRNEWEIKLKSIIYSDRPLNAVQNSVIISFSSCFFTVEKFPFLSTCHEKMTFSRNTFLITQRVYELMSWNFVR